MFDTMNRTWKSYLLFIIIMQELQISKILPKHSHDWSLFVTPRELKKLCAKNGIGVLEIKGKKKI